jgi:hypothetical protein
MAVPSPPDWPGDFLCRCLSDYSSGHHPTGRAEAPHFHANFAIGLRQRCEGTNIRAEETPQALANQGRQTQQ